MSFIFSLLILFLVAMGVAVMLRQSKAGNSEEQGSEPKSSGESIAASISEVFSKRKEDFSKARDKVVKGRFSAVPFLKTPPVPKNFVGRKNILVDIASRLGKGPVLIGLNGKAGVGKTSLAGVVVNQLSKRFNEKKIYVDMQGGTDTPLLPEEVMSRVINLLAPSKKIPENESKRDLLYTALLQRGKYILFLDNVPNLQSVKRLLVPANCALILTSQKPLPVPKMISKKINPLDTGDAQKLLMKTSPRTGFWGNEIAKICGDFPLTLVLAGQFIGTYQNQDCAIFLESLRQGVKELKDRPGDALQKSLDVVLNICYRSLSEKASGFLRKLVLFPESFDSKAAIFLCENSDNEHLVRLLSLSLLSHNEKTNRFYFHPQIRRFLMLRLKAGEQALAEKRFAAYFLTVLIAASEFYAKGGKDKILGLNLFDVEWENIDKGRAWAEANSEQDTEADNLCLSYAEAAVSLLTHRKSLDERRLWFEAALGSAKRLNESEVVPKYHLLLGGVHTQLDQGEEALEYLEEALELAKQVGDKTTEMKALGQLGLAHLALGKPHRAIEFLEKELRLLQSSEEPKGEEFKLENLGRIHFEVGDTEKAIEYYKKELDLAKDLNDTKRQGRVYGDLGEIYVSLKDQENAIESFDRGLALVKKFGDKKGEVGLLGKLGEAYTAVEKYKKALSSFGQGLKLAEEMKDQKNVCSLAEKMGHSYMKSGNHREAIPFYQKTLGLSQKSGDKAKEGETLWNLAEATKLSEKTADAIALAELALVLYQKVKRLDRDTRETIEKKLAEWKQMPDVVTSEDVVVKPVQKSDEEVSAQP
jgi:tetratricopeptide (TPR) repeat protein